MTIQRQQQLFQLTKETKNILSIYDPWLEGHALPLCPPAFLHSFLLAVRSPYIGRGLFFDHVPPLLTQSVSLAPHCCRLRHSSMKHCTPTSILSFSSPTLLALASHPLIWWSPLPSFSCTGGANQTPRETHCWSLEYMGLTSAVSVHEDHASALLVCCDMWLAGWPGIAGDARGVSSDASRASPPPPPPGILLCIISSSIVPGNMFPLHTHTHIASKKKTKHIRYAHQGRKNWTIQHPHCCVPGSQLCLLHSAKCPRHIGSTWMDIPVSYTS